MTQVRGKKNDKAWETLFKEYNILEGISKQGYFEISSSQINAVRESRLMAKFDHYENLPKILKIYNLLILPISRSLYVIGHFNIHHKVKYDPEIEKDYFEISESLGLESINRSELYSENSALLYAFNAGIIDHLIGEKTFYTVSGRMSTEIFNLEITNTKDNSLYNFKVKNAQCEIDGGFESENYFLIIEAKNYSIDDVSEVFDNMSIIPEPYKIPFPQADIFERVIDLLSLLMEKNLTQEEVTNQYQFHGRQTGYYTNAVIYIGLVKKYKDKDTKKITYSLTDEGRDLLKKSHKNKILALIKRILQHQVFYKAFQLTTENGKVPDKKIIEQVILENNLNIKGKTIDRRSQTVRGWIEWILEQIE